MAGAFRRVPLWFIVCGLVLFLSGVALFIGTRSTAALAVALGVRRPQPKIDPAGTLRLARID